jgi:hypothetical protein
MSRLRSILDDLIALPTTHKSKKWSFYFDRAVKEVRVTPSHIAEVRVSLVLKASERAWWMGVTFRRQAGMDRLVGGREWRERTGCPEGVELCGVVGR